MLKKLERGNKWNWLQNSSELIRIEQVKRLILPLQIHNRNSRELKNMRELFVIVVFAIVEIEISWRVYKKKLQSTNFRGTQKARTRKVKNKIETASVIEEFRKEQKRSAKVLWLSETIIAEVLSRSAISRFMKCTSQAEPWRAKRMCSRARTMW